jgi:hypothetical protein
MKKTFLIVGMLLISLQLPFCPYRLLSNEWVNRLELGRKFLVPIVLEAYGWTSPESNTKTRAAQPKGFVSVKVNYSIPGSPCSESQRASH